MVYNGEEIASKEDIFLRYKDNVFAIGFNYFRNESDADDIVQETFYKLFKAFDQGKKFESQQHIRNWIIRVAVNECKRVTLSSWFKKAVPLADYEETLKFENPEESQVFAEVMNLPKKYRQVVHLYYYEGFTTKEIASIINISESNVSTRLLRARKILKQKLSEVWKDE